MTTSTSTSSTTTPSTKLTPADRIAELNEIDKSIAHLLAAASSATAVLSNSASAAAEINANTNTNSLEEAQEAFKAASSDYFSTLSSIDVRLRRQVYALEEAGLIPAGTERDARRGRTPNAGLGGGTGDAGAGGRVAGAAVGGGPLDPSWLNARAIDGVEIRKKMELLREGKQLITSLGVLEGVKNKNVTDEMDEGEG